MSDIVQFGKYSIEKNGKELVIFFENRERLRFNNSILAGLKVKKNPEVIMGAVALNRKIIENVKSSDDWFVSSKDGKAIVNGLLQDGKTKWEIVFYEKEDALFFSASLQNYDEIELHLNAETDENFFGFGEQFSHFDMSGKSFMVCTTEQGVGRGVQPLSFLVNTQTKNGAGNEFTTYAPMPLFVSSKNYALSFEKNTIYHFDIKKSKKDSVIIQADTNELSGYLFFAESSIETLEKHTALTGRVKPLPDFAYGVILGVRGGKKVAEEILQKCLDYGTPVTALWIEDWQGRRGKNGGPPLWWRWYPDEDLYPDFKNWAKNLKERGIALLGYANPFLSADSENPLFIEAEQKGYLAKELDGSAYVRNWFFGDACKYTCIDIANPEAYKWLKQKMKEGMIDNGLAGWMADYGEYFPFRAKSYTKNRSEAHCEIPYLWAKLNSELIDETNNRGKILTFHRSASVGSNKYATAYWAGDQNPTFDTYDGLASSIVALISSGVSGMSINHTDIGGFTTIMTPFFKLVRKKEVMLRWLEYAAFTPVMRTHDGAYSNPLNYQFYYDDDGYKAFAKMGNLHHGLMPYFKKLEAEAVSKGIPMTRALFLHYPNDLVCKTIKYQYLLGEDILVSPVYKKKATSVKAYVPNGIWILPYTGKEFLGGKFHEIEAPLGKPPVLIKKNGQDSSWLIECIKNTIES